MAIYEKDGTEIRPKGDLEYICPIGGEFDETKVVLCAYSKQLDKQEVSNLLEVAPTKAWNPNEPHPMGNKERIRVVDWGKWSFECSTPVSVEQQIEILLSQCTNNLEHWRLLTEKYEVWLSVVGYLHNWNRELDLSSRVLRLLVDRNLALKVDVYFYRDREEGAI